MKVFPNPWAAFDRDGDPCGLCPRDVDKDAGGPGRFVGARVDPQRTKVLQTLAKGDDIRSPMQSTKYSFMGIASDDSKLGEKLLASEPIDIPNTRYYRQAIANGALIPADAEAARDARVRTFVSPKELVARLSGKPEPRQPAPVATKRRSTKAEADS